MGPLVQAKQKNSGETEKDEASNNSEDEDLTQHLQQWV